MELESIEAPRCHGFDKCTGIQVKSTNFRIQTMQLWQIRLSRSKPNLGWNASFTTSQIWIFLCRSDYKTSVISSLDQDDGRLKEFSLRISDKQSPLKVSQILIDLSREAEVGSVPSPAQDIAPTQSVWSLSVNKGGPPSVYQIMIVQSSETDASSVSLLNFSY